MPRTCTLVLTALGIAGALAACSDVPPAPTTAPVAAVPTTAAPTPVATPTATGSAAAVTVPPTAAGCNSAPQSGVDHFADKVTLKTETDGLQEGDFHVGCGALVQTGNTATVQYTGWLESGGTPFDSSRDSGRQPFPVAGVGQAAVIQGWNEGLIGMRAGGKRRLVIPAALGYGAAGQPPKIPANSTLVFDIEVLTVT